MKRQVTDRKDQKYWITSIKAENMKIHKNLNKKNQLIWMLLTLLSLILMPSIKWIKVFNGKKFLLKNPNPKYSLNLMKVTASFQIFWKEISSKRKKNPNFSKFNPFLKNKSQIENTLKNKKAKNKFLIDLTIQRKKAVIDSILKSIHRKGNHQKDRNIHKKTEATEILLKNVEMKKKYQKDLNYHQSSHSMKDHKRMNQEFMINQIQE